MPAERTFYNSLMVVIALLVMSVRMTLLSASAQSPDAPTPTLDWNQRQVQWMFANQIGVTPSQSAVCGVNAITPAGRLYNENLIRAINTLLANSDAWSWDASTLQAIIQGGLAMTQARISVGSRGDVVVFAMRSDAVLAYVGYIWCSNGSHYRSWPGELVVFTRDGAYWRMGAANQARAELAPDGWIALVDGSVSSISGDYHRELWHIRRLHEAWIAQTIDTFTFGNNANGIAVDRERVLVHVRKGNLDPPCVFNTELTAHALYISVWGDVARVYAREQGDYGLVDEILDTIHVSVHWNDADEAIIIEDWQRYCVE